MINKITLHNGGKALAAHLQKREDNEQVRIVSVGGGLPEDIDVAIETLVDFAAARSRHGTKRPFAHFAFSPDKALSEDQVQQCVRDVLLEYELPADQPYVLVGHIKRREDGSRIEHYHLVALTVKPEGKVTDFTNRYQRNEALARKWEIDFGHALTVGRHNRAAAHILAERGYLDAAQALATLITAPQPVARYTHAQAQAAKRKERSKSELTETLHGIAEAWRQSDGGAAFEAALAARGMFLALGTKAVLVIDPEGQEYPLLRTLKGQGLDLRKKDIDLRLEGCSLPTLMEGKHRHRRQAAQAELEASHGVGVPDLVVILQMVAAHIQDQIARKRADIAARWALRGQQRQEPLALAGAFLPRKDPPLPASPRRVGLGAAVSAYDRQLAERNAQARLETRNGIRAPEAGPGALQPAWAVWRQQVLTEAYGQKIGVLLGRWVRIERGDAYLRIHNQKLDVYDYGDRLVAVMDGTEEEIQTMLQLAEAKGWKELDLTGSAEFQERAGAAALAAGFVLKDKDLVARIAAAQGKAGREQAEAVTPEKAEGDTETNDYGDLMTP